MKVRTLLLTVAVLAMAVAGRAQADELSYVGTTNGITWNVGTVDSAGHTTPVGALDSRIYSTRRN